MIMFILDDATSNNVPCALALSRLVMARIVDKGV